MSEANLMRAIQLDGSKIGGRWMRNNVGAWKTSKGWLHYGVGGNGGSDLIGMTLITITAAMVGKTIPVFTAIEVKVPGEVPTDEKDDQVVFLRAMQRNGCIQGFATSPAEALEIIRKYRVDLERQ